MGLVNQPLTHVHHNRQTKGYNIPLDAKDSDTLTDQALINRITQADPAALQTFYLRHQQWAFGFALNALGERKAAETVTLAVFLHVWHTGHRYQPEQMSVKGWLITIIRKTIADHLQNQSLSTQAPQPKWAIPPEESALSNLSTNQQTILALAYFRGNTLPQIATHLDLPLDTVKTQLRLGMQNLGQPLSPMPLTASSTGED